MTDHYKTLGVAAQRERRRDQEGLSQARARDAPRQASGRSGCRGALQADRAGQRDAVRSREAPAVRPAGRGRHARRRAWRRLRPARCSTRTASTSPTCSAASSAAAGGAGRVRPQPQRGHDLEAGVTISFRDSLNGARVSIAVEALAPCTDCHGSGAAAGTRPEHVPRLRRPRRARTGPGILLALAAVPALRRHRSRDRAPVRQLRRARLDAAPAPLCRADPGRHQGRRAHPPARQGRGGHARRARRRPLRAGHGRALAGLHAARRRSRRRRARALQRGCGGRRRSTCPRPTASACA